MRQLRVEAIAVSLGPPNNWQGLAFPVLCSYFLVQPSLNADLWFEATLSNIDLPDPALCLAPASMHAQAARAHLQ